jgi:5S rRNA maturation endonuclease (ribonuclease M5)
VSVGPLGIPDEAGVGGPVLVLADFDRLGRMWNAWAIVDELGDVQGAVVDVEDAVQWEGASVARAKAIVYSNCGGTHRRRMRLRSRRPCRLPP